MQQLLPRTHEDVHFLIRMEIMPKIETCKLLAQAPSLQKSGSWRSARVGHGS